MISDDAVSGWYLEPNDFGGYIVRHRHDDHSAIAYV